MDGKGKERTVFIQKDRAKGTVASNYRPIIIACLQLMWRLLTGILVEKLHGHLQGNRNCCWNVFGNVIRDDKQRLLTKPNSTDAVSSSKFVRIFSIVLSFRLGH